MDESVWQIQEDAWDFYRQGNSSRFLTPENTLYSVFTAVPLFSCLSIWMREERCIFKLRSVSGPISIPGVCVIFNRKLMYILLNLSSPFESLK